MKVVLYAELAPRQQSALIEFLGEIECSQFDLYLVVEEESANVSS